MRQSFYLLIISLYNLITEKKSPKHTVVLENAGQSTADCSLHTGWGAGGAMLPPALTDRLREGARRGSLQREGELGLPPPQDKQAAGQGDTGTYSGWRVSAEHTHCGPLPGPDTHTGYGPPPDRNQLSAHRSWRTHLLRHLGHSHSLGTCFSAGPQVKGQY